MNHTLLDKGMENQEGKSFPSALCKDGSWGGCGALENEGCVEVGRRVQPEGWRVSRSFC